MRSYVVTGVSNGIGAALAGILVRQGHRVIGMDISAPSAELAAFVEVDLSDPAAVATAALAVEGELHGLCNCAGLPPREGLETKILDVNFLGTRALTQALEAKFAPDASVVNLASRAGARWRENTDQCKRLAALAFGGDTGAFVRGEAIDPVRAYDLSKEAVILWTMARNEGYLQRGWRINSISPGAVETRILTDFATAFGERMSGNLARAGRAGQPYEIAELAAFLLSPQSSWIKGVDVGIDGGMSAFNLSDALSLEAMLG